MKKSAVFNFIVDKVNNTIRVERSFEAPIELVWASWTESDILDQWWAPKPYRAITKTADLKKGGIWHYFMLSPEGEKQWCLFKYDQIKKLEFFSGRDAFCDENAKMNDTKPSVKWLNTFSSKINKTMVYVQMSFESSQDLETILDMGMKEGFTAALDNLDQYISAQYYLRNLNFTDRKPRVCTYLNFGGNTEDAFYFYKSVFHTDFVNGMTRFSELPVDPTKPPLSDRLKKMILHVELPITGGHSLMGTDAPKEMGFSTEQGNNMHIHIETQTRKEANRIFHALSVGGEIDLPIQDMYWGAYYGSFKDKFGVNWMINFQNDEQITLRD